MGIKLNSFNIVLDRSESVYNPGETVCGNCIIGLDGKMKLKQLTIKLEGKGTVSLGGIIGGYNTRPLSAKEVYVNEVFHLGEDQSSVLSSGKHNIGFSFKLPARRLPSSFEGDAGYIRYILEAAINKAGEKRQLNIIVQSVATHVPLQQLNQAVKISKNKNLGWFGSQPVSMKCQLKIMGYNFGTSIPVKCFIDNHSNKSMTLRASLYQEVSYFVRHIKKKIETKMSQTIGCSVQGNGQSTQELSLLVPTMVPVIDPDSCRIIKIQYKVVVTLAIPGSFDLHGELPVIFTNVRLDLDLDRSLHEIRDLINILQK